MSAALFLRGGNALHSVNACLASQDLVAARLRDFQDRVCEADLGAGSTLIGFIFDEVSFPASGGAECGVHVK